jgi:hypothetical protein
MEEAAARLISRRNRLAPDQASRFEMAVRAQGLLASVSVATDGRLDVAPSDTFSGESSSGGADRPPRTTDVNNNVDPQPGAGGRDRRRPTARRLPALVACFINWFRKMV